jgi:hypothetical protein
MKNKKCNKCSIEKSTESFYNSKKSKDGKENVCIKCRKKLRVDRILNITYISVSHKKCRKCSTIKPANKFGKNIGKKDGRTINCLDCINKAKREKNRLKNEGLPRKKSNKYSTQDFKEALFETMGEDYELVGEYVPNEKSTILHKPCGKTREVALSNVFRKGCRECSNLLKSSLSSRIENALRKRGVCYKTEVIFKDCKNIKPLPFDFGLYKNEKLIMLIEADGMQHFYETGYGYGTLKDIQKRDKIKNKYCKDSNIPLLRISYLQELEVDSIINKNTEKGDCIKKPKKYFTKSIVTEELAKNIREYCAKYGGNVNKLMEKFGLNRDITLKVLYYNYYPNIRLDLKNKIDNNLHRERHPKRLWEELSEEEQKEVITKKKDCLSTREIVKLFDLCFNFHYKVKGWNTLCKTTKPHRFNGRKCKHIETGKEFKSLREGCEHFLLSYNIQLKRISGQNKGYSEFQYIS